MSTTSQTEVNGVRAVNPRKFEEYVAIALHARENRDECQWTLGDVANEVKVFYGADSIGKLAVEIGMKKSTLMSYRNVCRIFAPAKRISGLSFTHHQIVTPLQDGEKWLHKAADEMWSCDKLTYEIHQTNPVNQANEDPKIRLCAEYLKPVIDEFVKTETNPTPQQCRNIVQRIVELYKRRS